MADAGAAKAKKVKKEVITPSVETNRRVIKECSKVTVDVKKVEEIFNVSRKNAIVLAAAAEHNLAPVGGGQKS